MKWLLTIYISLIIACSLSAQHHQWYVWNGNGIEWTKEGGQIQPPTWEQPVNEQVLINGITPIDPTDNKTMHDVFVIYKNGEYFNSRGRTRDVNDEFNSFSNNQLALKGYTYNQHFNGEFTTKTNEIAFLYWTNLYDGDDDPEEGDEISVTPAQSANSVLELTAPKSKLSANHDVVKNTDIVIVIPPDLPPLSFHFGNIVDLQRVNVNSEIQLFTHYQVIHNATLQPRQAIQNTKGSINLETHKKLPTYVVLSVNSELGDLAKNLDRQAEFYLSDKNTGENFYHHYEMIRDSHDPNFVEVLDVCHSKKENTYSVKYRLNCQNTGSDIVNRVHLIFQNSFESHTQICLSNFYMNNVSSMNFELTPEFQSHEIEDWRSELTKPTFPSTFLPRNYFVLEGEGTINTMEVSEEKSNSYMDFCVTFFGQLPEDLSLESPFVVFDGKTPYPIETQILPRKVTEDCIETIEIRQAQSCPCDCEKNSIRSDSQDFQVRLAKALENSKKDPFNKKNDKAIFKDKETVKLLKTLYDQSKNKKSLQIPHPPGS